jgi:hypothetical protein
VSLNGYDFPIFCQFVVIQILQIGYQVRHLTEYRV